MPITELYVDPSIAGDSGAGTDISPYGDLQWCLDQEAFDTTNGTRINVTVGDGTAEILAAALDTATNFFNLGGPSDTAPFIVQGCKNESPLVAGDGDWATQAGIGRIDGNNKTLFASAVQYTVLRHLEIFNRAGAGYTYLVYLGLRGLLVECELHTHSGTTHMVRGESYFRVQRCHLRNLLSNQRALYPGDASLVRHNYIDITGNGSALSGIDFNGRGCHAYCNIIRVAGTTDGIRGTSNYSHVLEGNSIWSNGGSGDGIDIVATCHLCSLLNNVVEGFTGGFGIKAAAILHEIGGNHCYNNSTNYGTITANVDFGDNEDLSGSSPFADAANEDMTPQDVGNMKELAYPPSIISGDVALTAVMKRWKGALEPAEPAGGTASILGGGNLSGGFA